MNQLDQIGQPDQIDQILNTLSLESQLESQHKFQLESQLESDNNKNKERLIQVVISGKSKKFLGKLYTTKEIEQLDNESTQKLYARYEAVLGGEITKKLKEHFIFAYARSVSLICPTLNYKIVDKVGLCNSLKDGPFVDLALSSLTCKLYHEYGHLLAPIEAAIITSNYLSADTDLKDLKDLKVDDQLAASQNSTSQLQEKQEDGYESN